MKKQNIECPECGAPLNREVIVGIAGLDWGKKYECGSIFWPEKNKITVKGVACGIIAGLKKQLKEQTVAAQPNVVLDEHRRMVEALHEIRRPMMSAERCRRIAAHALPMSETPRTPNVLREPSGTDGSRLK
jgi:hypothetical protein